MKKLITFALIAFSFSSLACHIELPERILIIENNNNDLSYQNASDCSLTEKEKLHEILMSTDGKITALQMMRMIQVQADVVLTIAPHLIQIDHLKNIARAQLPLPQSIFVKEIRPAIGMKSLYPMKNGDQIQLTCQDCLYGLNQKLVMTHNEFIGDKIQHLLTINFGKLTKAYKLTQPLQGFAELKNPALYQEDYIEVMPHTELVQDARILKFFKTNKPLKAGVYLRKADLVPMNLVRAGDQTELIFQNAQIEIKTGGIARNNGGHGDSVEVFVPEKKRKYLGKVIDDHKVVVEL
ncbi:MAG: flagella basal body P-ring formation protein FlgA [Bacteriovoracaceae bacterium]